MFPKLPKTWSAITAALACVVLLCGCGRWRVPAIDPTGQRIFAPAGSYTTLEPRPFAGFGQPAFTAPPTPGPCLDLPPTLPPQAVADTAAPQAVTVPNTVSPNVVPALPASTPVSIVGGVRGSLVLSPSRLIAPVGSEVVLKAGLCGGDGYYVVDQPIDWALSQESVGHIVAVGKNDDSRLCDRLLHNNPRGHRDATFAEGRTLSRRVILQRGGVDGSGQEEVLNGQSWVSVSSMAEGTTRVAAMAPNVPFWNGRGQTAIIEWIDAQWTAPAPAIIRSGTQHTFTTNVTRSTDGSPLVGWIVRYEIIEGAPAQFVSYEGAAGVAADATTDSNGQASVTISPTTNGSGMTHVRVSILRPAAADGSRGAIAVGDAYTSVTWSAPGLAATMVGPQQVNAGEVATYHIEITNPGDMPVSNVDVAHILPPEMTYIGSSPPGQVFGNRVQWQLPTIDPGMVMGIDVSCRADAGGDAAHLVNISTAEGLATEATTVTRVLQSGLTIQMSGPVSVEVGQPITFEVVVTNQTGMALTNVRAADDLSSGLQHESGVPRIERPLGDLGPGESVEFAVTFTAMQTGQLCHVISATADGGHFASARACVVASPAGSLGGQVGPALNDPQAGPARPPEPAFEVRVDSAEQVAIGQVTQFNIVVTNTGTAPLSNMRVTSQVDPQLTHTFAEPGFVPTQGAIYWTIPQLPVGHQVAMRVQARCDAAAARACHRATAQCDQLAMQSAEGCVQIVNQANRPGAQEPTPAERETDDTGADDLEVSPATARRTDSAELDNGLRVSVSTLARGLLAGDAATCLIQVHNDRAVADQDVELTLQLPKGLRVERFVDGPAEIATSDASTGIVTFRPIRELRADEAVTFRVRVRMQRSGRAEINATATSRRQMEAANGTASLYAQ